MAIDARRVDAGLGKLIAAFVIALVDEDLVIDIAGNDGELGAGGKCAPSCNGVLSFTFRH
jgi:hypothetical protein